MRHVSSVDAVPSPKKQFVQQDTVHHDFNVGSDLIESDVALQVHVANAKSDHVIF